MNEGFPDNENDSEKLPQISPEDLKEMHDQIPALREMLDDRRVELKSLEDSSSENVERMEVLKTEIEELELEIQGREESGL